MDALDLFERRRPGRRSFIVAVVALVLSLGAVGVLFSLALRDSSTLTVREPMKVLTPRVHPGDAVTISVDYCKDQDDVAVVGTVLARRGVFIPVLMWPSDLPVGCHVVSLTLPIPSYVPPNRYVLYMVREYRPTIGAVRGVSVRTEPFDVVPLDQEASPPYRTRFDDPKYDKLPEPPDPWGRPMVPKY